MYIVYCVLRVDPAIGPGRQQEVVIGRQDIDGIGPSLHMRATAHRQGRDTANRVVPADRSAQVDIASLQLRLQHPVSVTLSPPPRSITALPPTSVVAARTALGRASTARPAPHLGDRPAASHDAREHDLLHRRGVLLAVDRAFAGSDRASIAARTPGIALRADPSGRLDRPAGMGRSPARAPVSRTGREHGFPPVRCCGWRPIIGQRRAQGWQDWPSRCGGSRTSRLAGTTPRTAATMRPGSPRRGAVGRSPTGVRPWGAKTYGCSWHVLRTLLASLERTRTTLNGRKAAI